MVESSHRTAQQLPAERQAHSVDLQKDLPGQGLRLGSANNRRLAVFLPGLYGGGAERTMLNLADGFARRGALVDLVVGVVDGPLQDQIPQTVRYVPLHARRTLTVLPALVSYLRKENPVAMLSALNRANLMALWASRLATIGTKRIGTKCANWPSTRMVISERNMLSSEAGHGGSLADRLYPLLGRLFYPWADAIVAVSQSVADDLVKTANLSPERITTIYNPVVTEQLRKRAEEPLEHPWFGQHKPPVILGVGRLSEQKDFATLIRAFARVRSNFNARLLILGEGPLRAELEALVVELGIEQVVSMPGWVSNPVAYMREAALFVLCSRWEGLPGALIEALFAGVPVIATDAPGGSREILQEGRFGALIPPGDVEALTLTIQEKLAAPRQPAPPASWQPFESERILDRYGELFITPK